MKIALRVATAIFFLLPAGSAGQAKHPLDYEDLVKVRRVSDPQVSPNGRWIAYVVAVADLGANKLNQHIWLISTGGGAPEQLTRGEGSDTRPRWSPDGQSLAFISTRGGTSQVWIIPVSGGEARPLTSLPAASNPPAVAYPPG